MSSLMQGDDDETGEILSSPLLADESGGGGGVTATGGVGGASLSNVESIPVVSTITQAKTTKSWWTYWWKFAQYPILFVIGNVAVWIGIYYKFFFQGHMDDELDSILTFGDYNPYDNDDTTASSNFSEALTSQMERIKWLCFIVTVLCCLDMFLIYQYIKLVQKHYGRLQQTEPEAFVQNTTTTVTTSAASNTLSDSPPNESTAANNNDHETQKEYPLDNIHGRVSLRLDHYFSAPNKALLPPVTLFVNLGYTFLVVLLLVASSYLMMATTFTFRQGSVAQCFGPNSISNQDQDSSKKKNEEDATGLSSLPQEVQTWVGKYHNTRRKGENLNINFAHVDIPNEDRHETFFSGRHEVLFDALPTLPNHNHQGQAHIVPLDGFGGRSLQSGVIHARSSSFSTHDPFLLQQSSHGPLIPHYDIQSPRGFLLVDDGNDKEASKSQLCCLYKGPLPTSADTENEIEHQDLWRAFGDPRPPRVLCYDSISGVNHTAWAVDFDHLPTLQLDRNQQYHYPKKGRNNREFLSQYLEYHFEIQDIKVFENNNGLWWITTWYLDAYGAPVDIRSQIAKLPTVSTHVYHWNLQSFETPSLVVTLTEKNNNDSSYRSNRRHSALRDCMERWRMWSLLLIPGISFVSFWILYTKAGVPACSFPLTIAIFALVSCVSEELAHFLGLIAIGVLTYILASREGNKRNDNNRNDGSDSIILFSPTSVMSSSYASSIPPTVLSMLPRSPIVLQVTTDMMIWALYSLICVGLLAALFASTGYEISDVIPPILLCVLVAVSLILNHRGLQVIAWAIPFVVVFVFIMVVFVDPDSDGRESNIIDGIMVLTFGTIGSLGLYSIGYTIIKYRAYVLWYSRRFFRELERIHRRHEQRRRQQRPQQ